MNIWVNGKVISNDVISKSAFIVSIIYFINIYYYMKNIPKIKLNLITEKLYLDGMVNEIYENISHYDNAEVEAPLLMERLINEENNNEILRGIIDDLKLAPKFVFTFGTGIGAFYKPIEDLLSGSGINVTPEQIVLVTLTSLVLLSGEDDAKKLMEKVKDEGLTSTLKGVKNFISNTKEVINSITRNVIGTTYSLLDILGFTFLLVPTMEVITKLINDYGLTIGNLESMFSGLALSIVTYTVKNTLKKIKNKFI